jgi:SpoVK/Ycf46/Vps4 family AAA+-type ATPase
MIRTGIGTTSLETLRASTLFSATRLQKNTTTVLHPISKPLSETPINAYPVNATQWKGLHQIQFGNTNPGAELDEAGWRFLNRAFRTSDNQESYTVAEMLLVFNEFDAEASAERSVGFNNPYSYLMDQILNFRETTTHNEVLTGLKTFGLLETPNLGSFSEARLSAKGKRIANYIQEKANQTKNLDKAEREALVKQVKAEAVPFFNRQFYNKNFDNLTAGQILTHLIKRSGDCNDKVGAPSGEIPAYPSRFFTILHKELGIEDSQVQLMLMQAFKKFGLFKTVSPEKSNDPMAGFDRVSLKPVAVDLIGEWYKSVAEGAFNQAIKDKRYDFITPPLDFNKMSPSAAASMINFKPDVIEKVKEKVKTQEDRIEGTKARLWLKSFFGLPWVNETRDKADVVEARKVFDSKFYGMDALKNRLIEEIAVRNFKGGNKGGIILLWGPPGTGKTACAETLAEVMGRKFVRRSMAGISDAQKITGHDYTYVGSKPGMIIDGMVEAGTVNPVFQIDEIDKIGKDGMKGNPLDALLAVLDPQQNDKFTDSYLDTPVDLSKVLFVVTANRIEDFPTPLLSRTEIIRFDAYLPEEKIEIAKRHLIPKQYKEYNIAKEKVTFSDTAVSRIINGYTLEGGVRKLEQKAKELFRKAGAFLQQNPQVATLNITPERVDEWLTNPIVKDKIASGKTQLGRVNGMYYSENGGGTLPVEVTLSQGKGQLILTGSLGNVMQEAAKVALSFIKATSEALGIADATAQKLKDGTLDIHIHYPSGATPKDGPSAGSSTFTALWSKLSNQPIPTNLAMTGEIDLQGNITQIGGVLEKMSGAVSQGVQTVLLPKANQKDYEDLCRRSESFRKMTSAPVDVQFVETAMDVVRIIKEKTATGQTPTQ